MSAITRARVRQLLFNNPLSLETMMGHFERSPETRHWARLKRIVNGLISQQIVRQREESFIVLPPGAELQEELPIPDEQKKPRKLRKKMSQTGQS